MGSVLIDTDVLIWLLEKAPREVLEKISFDFELLISVISVFEFLTGVFRKKKNGRFVTLLKEYFNIVPVTFEIVKKAAEIEANLIKQGSIIPLRDILIGATAIVIGVELWTHDLFHFERLRKFGLKLFDETRINILKE